MAWEHELKNNYSGFVGTLRNDVSRFMEKKISVIPEGRIQTLQGSVDRGSVQVGDYFSCRIFYFNSEPFPVNMELAKIKDRDGRWWMTRICRISPIKKKEKTTTFCDVVVTVVDRLLAVEKAN